MKRFCDARSNRIVGMFAAAGLLVCGFLAEQSAAAQAVAQPGLQMTRGLVVGVSHNNGQPMFRVRTALGNNRVAGAALPNNGRAAGQNHTQFVVGPGTQFEAARGMNVTPASFAMLRSGQQVLVESQGAQAMRVRIVPRARSAGYRPSSGRTGHHYGQHSHYHAGAIRTSATPIGAIAQAPAQQKPVHANKTATHMPHRKPHK